MRNRLLPIAAAFGALTVGTHLVAQGSTPALPKLDDSRAIVHVLDRISFGVRPGDIDIVRATGLDRYIDQQLHPDRIPDAAMDARLTGLTTVRMSTQEIATNFESPQIEARREHKRQAAGKGDQPPAPQQGMQPRGNEVMTELMQQKLLRAIYSERQL